MKKKEQNLTIPTLDRNISLKKADDWTRRAFINRAAITLAALGVPWLPKMEIMEKVTRKILGNSVAYGAPAGFSVLINIAARNGYPTSMIAPFAAFASQDLGRANYHASAASTVTVAAAGSMMQPLYLSPQMAASIDARAVATGFDRSAFAQKFARVTNFSNSGSGHTNMFDGKWMTGGSHGADASFVTSHAETMAALRPTILSNPIIYGERTAVDFAAGRQVAAYIPTYVNSTAEVQALFKPQDLVDAKGKKLGATVLDGLYAIQNTDNGKYLEKLSSREGVDALRSGNDAMAALLKTNFSQQLDPANDATVAGYISALSTGVTIPTQRFDTKETIFEQVAIMLRAAELGIGNTFGMVLETQDWHGSQAGMDGTNSQNVTADPQGANTVQAQHAAFWGAFLPNLFALANTIILPEGGSIGDVLKVVIDSEFGRGLEGSPSVGDNPDGRPNECLLFGAGLKGGMYGDVQPDAAQPDPAQKRLSPMKPNLTTGAAESGENGRDNLVHTVRGFIGVDYDGTKAVKVF